MAIKNMFHWIDKCILVLLGVTIIFLLFVQTYKAVNDQPQLFVNKALSYEGVYQSLYIGNKHMY
jgi:hypothetical protein